MKYIIDKENRPVYLQIYKQLRDDIIEGAFPYNSKLPSKRLLANEIGVSTITIEHAYALLCDEGYAEARERSGFFVIFRKTDGFASPKDAAHISGNISASGCLNGPDGSPMRFIAVLTGTGLLSMNNALINSTIS